METAIDHLEKLAKPRSAKKPRVARNGHDTIVDLETMEVRPEPMGPSEPPGVDDDEVNLHLPLAQIIPSKTNPRKTFDPVKLQELADSIRVAGVQQPVLVRRHPTDFMKRDSPTYELVIGERRLRASQIAGKKTIPARIRSLTDAQASEIQCIENLQRADLDAFEEADGFQQILARHTYTVETLAAKVGKSKTYVYAALKLNGLPEKVKKAYHDGRASRSVCELLARIPNKKLRDEAAGEHGLGLLRGNVEVTYRDAKDHIERHFMRELKGAPFPLEMADLGDGVPTCKACPKRTGNNREEYPEGRADVCTDPACYEGKVKAWGQHQVEQAKREGKKVLSAAESREVFRGSYNGTQVGYSAKYLDAASSCWDDSKSRKYGALVGKDLAGDVVIAIDQEGRPHELLPKSKVEKLLKAKGIGRHANSAAFSRDRHKYRDEQAARTKVQTAAMAIAAEKAEHLTAGAIFSPNATKAMRLITLGQLRDIWQDIAKRRQITEEDLEASVATMTAQQCLGLLAESTAEALYGYPDGYNKSRREEFGAFFGIGKDGTAVAGKAKGKKDRKGAAK